MTYENQTTVPNLFPRTLPGTMRLAVVGEAPGADEVVAGEPFVGVSGRLLRAILGSSGIACDQVFFGNVCQHHIDTERADWNGPEITSGLERLRVDLQNFRPNCVLLLGKTAFRAFRPDLCYQTRKGFVIPLSDWRGSVFNSGFTTTDVGQIKCVACYHPAFILRSYSDMPYFKFDVARAVRHSRNPELGLVVRQGVIRPSLDQVLTYLQQIRNEHHRATFDIEGYADDVGVTMLSICTTPTDGIVIPFWIDGQNYWTENEEVILWQALAEFFYDASVPKVAHNAFYELFVLAWRHRIVVNNLADDTMMKRWELFPELERSLAVCCSMHTEQPYYKYQRLDGNSDVKLQYNLTDSQVTDEINVDFEHQLTKLPRSFVHYRFNINLIPAYNYTMLRGCRLDFLRVAELTATVTREIADFTTQINEQILDAALAADILTRKRKSDPWSFNVKSSTQKCWLLYDHLKYPILKRHGRVADEDVLLHYWTKDHNPLVRLIIQCVRKRTRLSDIAKLTPNADGRIRSSYDIVGTNTGRLSSRSSIALAWDGKQWDNTGTNLQNVTKELRACFVPDTPEHDFFQFDLSGADGWTVAADLANCGHSAMLDDYVHGIKPALVLYYMLQEQAAGRDPVIVNRLDRATLKLELKRVRDEIKLLDGKLDPAGRPADWQYLCCKRVQHGSNYGMAPKKLSEIIFGDSDGAIVLTEREAQHYQYLYKLRYNTDVRNERIRKTLSDTGTLVAACGIRRQFFSIRNRRDIDDAVVREASAFEPQANTTWATNKALERLWYDTTNRKSTGALHMEPLLQIHDAVAGQYKIRDREWAHARLKSYFENPLQIHGHSITIPVEGNYGTSWKDCKNIIT